MIITSIERQKRNNDRYNVFVDGEFSFSCCIEDIYKYSLNESLTIDKEHLEEIALNCEYTKAYNYSIKILNIKDYTREQIKNKLIDKGFSQKTVDIVIEKLMGYNFIDDLKFAQRYIDQCKNKQYGKNKILYNLEQIGLEKETLFNFVFDTEEEFNRALHLAEGKYKKVVDKNTMNKVYNYLFSRGFDYETIKRVINHLSMNDAEIF